MHMCLSQVVVGPALKILYNMGASDRLKPVVLRLACSLWQQQDRAFPHLLRMMADYESPAVGYTDAMLARAACVRDVCKLR